jgi:integrase/recombinase XerD
LFRPVRNNRTGRLEDAITADGVYRLVRRYSGQPGFLIGAHALRATAATNALDHQADIAKVQEWLAGTPTSPPRAFMTIAARGLRTARRSRSPIDEG